MKINRKSSIILSVTIGFLIIAFFCIQNLHIVHSTTNSHFCKTTGAIKRDKSLWFGSKTSSIISDNQYMKRLIQLKLFNKPNWQRCGSTESYLFGGTLFACGGPQNIQKIQPLLNKFSKHASDAQIREFHKSGGITSPQALEILSKPMTKPH
jgi:hypothetical protein